MVANAAHFIAMARGQRSFYTAPIKALVSEKFFALCEIFGPENVGMMTGDATVNGWNIDAPVPPLPKSLPISRCVMVQKQKSTK